MSLETNSWNLVDEAISSHIQYLLSIQRKDGGWGITEEAPLSSPHNTSEVLSALLKSSKLKEEKDDAIDRGIQYLLKTQCDDGGWTRGRISQGTLKEGHTIATSWSIQALSKSLPKCPTLKQDIQNSIRKAQNFLLDTSYNRNGIRGSWSEYRGGKSSVTASCCAILSLLGSQELDLDLNSNIISVCSQGLNWLLNDVQNSDGGIGFYRNDSSRGSTTILLIFTAAYAKNKGFANLDFTRAIQWFRNKIDKNAECELCAPEVEFPNYKTVLTQYQHFTTARITYILFKNYTEEFIFNKGVADRDTVANQINIVRERYLTKLLNLKFPRGGSLISEHSQLYIWATAQAIQALTAANEWRKARYKESSTLEESTERNPIIVQANSLERINNSSETDLLNILHLSDLHFSSSENANLWFSQLAEDLKRNLECETLDVVVVSGDLTERSLPEEYVLAKEFLDLLCQEFNLNQKQLVIVPGNHDVNWNISEAAYKLIRRHHHQGQFREGIDIEEGHSILQIRLDERYREKFEHFNRFYEYITGIKYPEEYEQQGIIHHFQKQNIVILGLNSAWDLDHHFRERVGIHPDALSGALNRIRSISEYDNCFKIAVWHHSVNDTGKQFVDRLVNAGFKVGMHGHIHEAIEEYFKYDTQHGLHIVGAGTFGASAGERLPGIPLQYNLLRLTSDKSSLTVETRKKERSEGVWCADARWGDKNKNPKPYYKIEFR